MARFDELIEKTKNEIRVLLRNPDIRPSYMTYDQLRDVQSEICRMARITIVVKLNEIVDLYNNREY